ncbi:MAG: universal stress protein [Syntrophobacteraceae bacterium]
MKVLVATDGSERSMKAVRRAVELAEKEHAEVTLLSIAYFFSGETEDIPADIQDYMDAEASKALEKGKALFAEKGIKVNTVMQRGLVPANVILEEAEEGKFDHILLGSTGKTGIKRYLIGSTAAKVVAHAPCSVTVLR